MNERKIKPINIRLSNAFSVSQTSPNDKESFFSPLVVYKKREYNATRMYPAYMLHNISFKINAHDKQKATVDRDRKKSAHEVRQSERERERERKRLMKTLNKKKDKQLFIVCCLWFMCGYNIVLYNS